MAFGRAWLKNVLQEDDKPIEEKVAEIMKEHVAVTDGLKEERDGYKDQAEKAADLQKELDGLQGGDDWQKKFEDEHKAFEDFKKQTASEAEAAKVKAAYRELLADEGIGAKRLDTIIRVTDFSKMKLDKDGSLENADELRKSINEEWSEFKTTVVERGATVEKPPHTGKPTRTREEILAIKDTTERQKAIAENLNLFGKG